MNWFKSISYKLFSSVFVMLPVKVKLVRKYFSGFKYFYEGRGELEFTNMQNLESAIFLADLQVKIAKRIPKKAPQG